MNILLHRSLPEEERLLVGHSTEQPQQSAPYGCAMILTASSACQPQKEGVRLQLPDESKEILQFFHDNAVATLSSRIPALSLTL